MEIEVENSAYVPSLAELNQLESQVKASQIHFKKQKEHTHKVLKKMTKSSEWRREWNRTISRDPVSKSNEEAEHEPMSLVSKLQAIRYEMLEKLQELETKLLSQQQELLSKRALYIAELRRQSHLRAESPPKTSMELLLTGAGGTSQELSSFLNEQLELFNSETIALTSRIQKPVQNSKIMRKLIQTEQTFIGKALSILLQRRSTREDLVANSVLFDYSYENPDGHSSQQFLQLGNMSLSLNGLSSEELQVMVLFQTTLRNLAKDGLIINWQDTEITNTLGEGAYSIVYQGWSQGRLVAIKLFKSTRAASIQAWIREVKALKACESNSKTIKMIGVCAESRDKLAIIMPLYKGGSIYDAIYKHGHIFSPQQALQISLDVAEGISLFHESDYIHRDITPSNILLHPDLYGKSFIGDFGIAVQTSDAPYSDYTFSPRGHPRYKAPEIYTKSQYSNKVDIYQFGTLLYTLFSNSVPYESFPDREVSAKMASGTHPALSNLPKSISKLISDCWSLNPTLRPTGPQLVEYLTSLSLSRKSVRSLQKSKSYSESSTIIKPKSEIQLASVEI